MKKTKSEPQVKPRCFEIQDGTVTFESASKTNDVPQMNSWASTAKIDDPAKDDPPMRPISTQLLELGSLCYYENCAAKAIPCSYCPLSVRRGTVEQSRWRGCWEPAKIEKTALITRRDFTAFESARS